MFTYGIRSETDAKKSVLKILKSGKICKAAFSPGEIIRIDGSAAIVIKKWNRSLLHRICFHHQGAFYEKHQKGKSFRYGEDACKRKQISNIILEPRCPGSVPHLFMIICP